jgi:hypothetical protein
MNWNLFLDGPFVTNGNGVPPPYGESTKSLDLNGIDEYVTVPGNSTLRGFTNGDVIVISGWIRIQETSGAVNGTIIMNEESPGSDDSQYALKYTTNTDSYPNRKFQLFFDFMDGSDPTNRWTTSVTYPFYTWRWYHVVIHHEYGDASSTKMYVNGVSQSGSWIVGSGNSNPISNSEDVFIGCDSGGQLAEARIDQLELYKSSTQWSAAEIQELWDDSLGTGLGVPVDGRDHTTRSGDIIAQWMLGENDDAGASGIKETVNGYHGTGTNLEASSFSAMSAGYYGVQFDGASSDINCGSGSGIDNSFSGGGSWSAWIMPFSDGENDRGRIMSKTDSGSTKGCSLSLDDESGGLCRLRFRVATTGTAGVWRTTNRVIPLRRFTHVGIVFDSDTLAAPTLIVDGTSVAVDPPVTSPTGSYVSEASENFLIGGSPAGVDRTFDGQIYSAAIWLSELIDTHWQEVYNGTAGDGDTGQPPKLDDLPTAPAPQAWWMWMGAIATGPDGVPDLAGNGHDGTMGGNAIVLNVGP